MHRRLPSLVALRSFEAAMRCDGLAAAARELSVTNSAVSHQIKQLENELGMKLVRREGRRLAMTEAGRCLMPAVQEAFQRISTTVASLQVQATQAPLSIGMVESFAVNWFLPRLHRFRGMNPDIKVRVSIDNRNTGFGGEPVDMAVQIADNCSKDLHWQPLFRDELAPVCSPEYLERHGPLHSPGELLAKQLLVSQPPSAEAWSRWFASVGVRTGELPNVLNLETSQLAVQAAANAIGVAIAGKRLTEPMLRRGSLVHPFGHGIPEQGSFYVVSPHAWSDAPKVRLMRNWLLSEAALN